MYLQFRSIYKTIFKNYYVYINGSRLIFYSFFFPTKHFFNFSNLCLLYTSPSPRDS